MNQRRFIAGLLGVLLVSQSGFSASSISSSRGVGTKKKSAPESYRSARSSTTVAERRLQRSMSPAPPFGLKDALSAQARGRKVRLPQGLVVNAPRSATAAASASGAPASGSAQVSAAGTSTQGAAAPQRPSNLALAAARSGVPVGLRSDWGGSVSLGYETSLHESGSPDANRALSLETAFWKRLGEGWRADGLVSGGQFLTGERQSQLQAAAIGVLHQPWKLSRSFRFRPRIVYNLPTFDEASRAATSRGGLALQGRLLFTPDSLPQLISFYQVSVVRNFYEYTTRGDGEANTAWFLSHRAVLVWNFSDSLSIQASPGISTGYTFEGTPSTAFFHNEEVSYAFSPVWSLSVGHQNEGPFYRENGRDVNFSVVNGQTSTVYLSLTNQF